MTHILPFLTAKWPYQTLRVKKIFSPDTLSDDPTIKGVNQMSLAKINVAALAVICNTTLALAETPADTASKAHDAYLAAINSNDLRKVLATVTDDVVLLAPNSPAIEGKEAASPWIAGYFEHFETQWQKTPLEFVVAGDWAFERYSYRVVDTPRNGGANLVDTGNGINIYRLEEDGVWRVARDAWASDQALPVTYDGMGPF